MSGIPISALSQQARWQLGLTDHTYSVASLRQIEEKYQLRLEQLRVQLVPNMHNAHVLHRVRAKVDLLESALDELHALISPSLIGGVYGGPSRQESGAAGMGLTPCRYATCGELIDHEDVFQRGGACQSCWNTAAAVNTNQIGDEHV